MGKVYYSVDEARRLIPKVKLILRRLIELHVKLAMQENVSIDYDEPFEQYLQSVREAHHWHRTQQRYFTLLRKLAEMGVFVKNPETGLIDFYSQHKGREIFLCYQYPEQTVSFWHELEGGYRGRKSVDGLKQEKENA